MAKPQEKVVTFLMTPYSPIAEHEQGAHDCDDDRLDGNVHDAFSANGCCCFHFFPFTSRRDQDESNYNLLNQKAEHRESWVQTKLKQVKEVSEKLAGPKWKTFIRKMGGYLKSKKQRNSKFQYSPQSYAMNFDGGLDSDGDDGLVPGFSSRFAAAPCVDEKRLNGL